MFLFDEQAVSHMVPIILMVFLFGIFFLCRAVPMSSIIWKSSRKK